MYVETGLSRRNHFNLQLQITAATTGGQDRPTE